MLVSLALAGTLATLAPVTNDALAAPSLGAAPASLELRLRPPRLDAPRAQHPWNAFGAMRLARGDARHDVLAQSAGDATPPTEAPATPPASDAPAAAATPATTPSSSTPAATANTSATTPAPASDGAQPADDAEPDIELIRVREHITRTHRALGIATLVSLGVTATLGTLLAFNEPTLFGPGYCSDASGLDVLGAFGCGPLSYVHEVSAFVTVGLYTATGIFALSMPDPEHAAVGNDARARRLRLHRALAWVHFVGMVLEPVLGVLSVAPGIVGVPAGAQQKFSTVLRTVHLGVGYVTLAALTTAMIVEF